MFTKLWTRLTLFLLMAVTVFIASFFFWNMSVDLPPVAAFMLLASFALLLVDYVLFRLLKRKLSGVWLVEALLLLVLLYAWIIH